MKISLVIPAYNEEDVIAECLASILKHKTEPFHEIIVVDNASTDATAQIASSFPGVRVVHEPRKGLPSARQRGFLSATGDVIAYVDADTRMPQEWPVKVRALFERYPGVVSISGPPRYFDATRMQSLLLMLGWWLSAPITYRITGYLVYGAHFAVRKDALEKIGGFDTAITFYGEDTDLARRLSKVGKTVFRMDFYIYTSARRFISEGIVRTMMRYSINFIWPVVFHRPYDTSHNDIRKKGV